MTIRGRSPFPEGTLNNRANSVAFCAAGHVPKHGCSVPFSTQIDLNEATWQRLLVQEGFQTSEPTVWLFEGLVMYLQPAAVVSLLEATSKVRLLRTNPFLLCLVEAGTSFCHAVPCSA